MPRRKAKAVVPVNRSGKPEVSEGTGQQWFDVYGHEIKSGDRVWSFALCCEATITIAKRHGYFQPWVLTDWNSYTGCRHPEDKVFGVRKIESSRGGQ
jgi:hypothetical protein